MLLNFDNVYNEYNPTVAFRGIVHVGAYDGGERKEYTLHKIPNVMWFEALPSTFAKLQENVKSIPGHQAFNYALTDVDGTTTFNVTKNHRGENGSSSILPLGKHLEYYPHVTLQEVIKVPCRRLDTFVRDKGIQISAFNFLNIDVQGAELRVIKGMGDLIDGFDYIMAEINEVELYKGGVLLSELTEYLETRGFELREKTMTKYNWGDGLFVKKTIPRKTSGAQ